MNEVVAEDGAKDMLLWIRQSFYSSAALESSCLCRTLILTACDRKVIKKSPLAWPDASRML